MDDIGIDGGFIFTHDGTLVSRWQLCFALLDEFGIWINRNIAPRLDRFRGFFCRRRNIFIFSAGAAVKDQAAEKNKNKKCEFKFHFFSPFLYFNKIYIKPPSFLVGVSTLFLRQCNAFNNFVVTV